MAEVVNLRRKRKEAAGRAARKVADENAVRFGESKDDRARRQAEAERAARHIDGHQREPER